jgi:hypothetical protein
MKPTKHCLKGGEEGQENGNLMEGVEHIPGTVDACKELSQ